MNHRFRDVIVDALRVLGVVGISRGDAREEILIAFAREQVAVVQSVLAELGQALVARESVSPETRARQRSCWCALTLVETSSLGVSVPVEKSIALPRSSTVPSRTVCSPLVRLGATAILVLFGARRGFSMPPPVEAGGDWARHRNIVIPGQNTRCRELPLSRYHLLCLNQFETQAGKLRVTRNPVDESPLQQWRQRRPEEPLADRLGLRWAAKLARGRCANIRRAPTPSASAI